MARQYKNPTFICVDCKSEIKRTASSQKRCRPCAQESKLSLARAHSRRVVASKVCISEIECAGCGISVKFKGTAHIYCDACAKAKRDEYGKLYRERNAERLRECARDYVRKHKAESKAYKARHRAANGDELRKKEAEAQRERLKEPGNRIHHSMSSMVRSSIINKHGFSWQSIVGYSRPELMRHLERQFTSEMDWNSYGKYGWHIDHILPRASFDFEDENDPEFKACWAMTNLRPLWCDENISKSDKRLYLI